MTHEISFLGGGENKYHDSMRHWLFLFLVGLTSYGQILTLSSQDIERLAKLSQGEVTGLKTAIAQQVLTHPLLTGTSITFHS